MRADAAQWHGAALVVRPHHYVARPRHYVVRPHHVSSLVARPRRPDGEKARFWPVSEFLMTRLLGHIKYDLWDEKEDRIKSENT